jgi:cell division septation protein DedD
LGFSLYGQITRQTSIALNVHMDRSPAFSSRGPEWATRSMLRLTRSMATGSVYVAGGAPGTAVAAGRGTGTVSGSVFADWNANGLPDADESLLEGIPLRLGSSQSATSREGQFAFLNVPVGLREVGLDTGALPIDYDPPSVTAVRLELLRGETKRVLFGLIPLGMIEGQVVRDANGNRRADPGDEPMDAAVVVLDGGARSEQVRRGRFRFDAVRSGEHLVKLLVESLPDGAVVAGPAEAKIVLGRDSLSASVPFLVSIEKRPEIRKVFPPRVGAAPAADPGTAIPRPPAGRAPAAPRSVAPGGASPRPRAAPAAAGFAIQIAALSDPSRARELVRSLIASGLGAYLVLPQTSEPGGLYRVRVGPYATRAAAARANAPLEKARGEKLWIVREPDVRGR